MSVGPLRWTWRSTCSTACWSWDARTTSASPEHLGAEVNAPAASIRATQPRHAQSQMLDAGISQEAFDRALLDPIQPDVPDGQDILWRERDGLRLVILTNPTPNRGAKLVKTVYRVQAQAKAIAGKHR